MDEPDLHTLTLKSKEEHRIRTGHLWVYSNEIDTEKSPLTQFQAGQQVRVCSAKQQFLGYAYINPKTLLCARILSQHIKNPISKRFLKKQLQHALTLRTQLFERPFYRLIHGEGDYLPGLVVDRYADILVCQFNTVGMECLKDDILSSLIELLSPAGILIKNEAHQRTLEGLELDNGVAYGTVPEDTDVITDAGTFTVPLQKGQKTGWFYDQAHNRQQLSHIQQVDQALDLFSYVGSWGIMAARQGAKRVVCVDSSQTALEYVTINAARNGVADQVQTLQGDAVDVAKSLAADKARFDLLMIDPPAFIKRKKDVKKGLEAYRRINELALRMSDKDSFVFTSSCSYHLLMDNLKKTLFQAAKHVDRQLQQLYQGQQAKDHPIHPAMPETHYLKTLLYRCSVR